jgi:hypothetical protein
MAKIQNLVMDQGSTFSQDISVDSAATGLNYDLSGYTVRAQMRRGYTSSVSYPFTATIKTPATDGIINLAFNADQSSPMKAGRYVYDIEIENVAGTIRVCEGIITITPEVTR